MVLGEDSCFEGREFKSQHGILDGHFFTLIISIVCLKRPKINEKMTI